MSIDKEDILNKVDRALNENTDGENITDEIFDIVSSPNNTAQILATLEDERYSLERIAYVLETSLGDVIYNIQRELDKGQIGRSVQDNNRDELLDMLEHYLPVLYLG